MSLFVPAVIPDRFTNRMDDERLKKLWELLQLKDMDDEETGRPRVQKQHTKRNSRRIWHRWMNKDQHASMAQMDEE